MNAVSTTPSLGLRRKFDELAGGFAVRPYIHVWIWNAVMPEHRADMRAVIVPVMNRLDQEDRLVDLEPEAAVILALDGFAGASPLCDVNQSVAALRRLLFERGNPRELAVLAESTDVSTKTPEITSR